MAIGQFIIDACAVRQATNDALREGQGTESSVTVATYQAVVPSGVVLRLPNSTGTNDKLADGHSIAAKSSSGQTGSSQSDGGKDDGEQRDVRGVSVAERKATTEHKLQGYGTRKSFWPVPANEVERIMLLLA